MRRGTKGTEQRDRGRTGAGASFVLGQPRRNWGCSLVHCTPCKGSPKMHLPLHHFASQGGWGRLSLQFIVLAQNTTQDLSLPAASQSLPPGAGRRPPCAAPGVHHPEAAPAPAEKRRARSDSAESVFRKRRGGKKGEKGEIKAQLKGNSLPQGERPERGTSRGTAGP